MRVAGRISSTTGGSVSEVELRHITLGVRILFSIRVGSRVVVAFEVYFTKPVRVSSSNKEVSPFVS